MSPIVPNVYDSRRAGMPQVSFDFTPDVNFVVGKSTRGPIDEVFVGSPDSIYRTFGEGDLPAYVQRANLNGASKFKVVRVLGANPVKATKQFLETATPVGSLTAKDYGAYGNDITVKWIENVTDERTLYVRYKGKQIAIVSGMTDGTSIVAKIADHPVLQNWLVYTKATNALPDESADWVALASGSDGSSITNSDVVGEYDSTTGARTGLQLAVITDGWSNLGVATLEGDATVNAGMITVCSQRGYGKAILTHDSSLTDAQIKSAADAIDAPGGCASFWAGWYQSYTQTTGTYVSPTAAIMGILCRVEVFESPSNQVILDALAVKRKYDDLQIEDLLLHKVNVVTYDIYSPSSAGIRTFHSLNASTDANIDEIQVKGTYDKLNNDIRRSIRFAISKPNTSILRGMVQNAADLVRTNAMKYKSVYADSMVENMWVKCDDTNNTEEDIKSKRIILDWAFQPIGAAHFVYNRSAVTSDGIETQQILEDVIN
jgi:hypothetical protein